MTDKWKGQISARLAIMMAVVILVSAVKFRRTLSSRSYHLILNTVLAFILISTLHILFCSSTVVK
jgi:hypothetical protein